MNNLKSKLETLKQIHKQSTDSRIIHDVAQLIGLIEGCIKVIEKNPKLKEKYESKADDYSIKCDEFLESYQEYLLNAAKGRR